MKSVEDFLREQEEPERIPITPEEYEDVLDDILLMHEQNLKDAQELYDQMIQTYRKYLIDKSKFRLEYYREDGNLIYLKFPLNKIGFEK